MSKVFHILVMLAWGLLLYGAPAAAAPGDGAASSSKSKRADVGEEKYKEAVQALRSSKSKMATVTSDLRESADAGYEPAVFLLWDIYDGKYMGFSNSLQNEGTKIAFELASGTSPWEKCQKNKDVRLEAQYRSALYLERGSGCAQSHKLAYNWMRKAAEGGSGKARVEFARFCMNGDKKHRPDAQLALRILLEQQRNDDSVPNLYFYLGHMYFNGLGLNGPDRKKALDFFTKGAEKGDVRAMNNLAFMYEHGIATSRDVDKAIRYYKMSAAGGNREAAANMQRLACRMEMNSSRAVARVDTVGMRIVRFLFLPRCIKELLAAFFHGDLSHYPA